MSPEEKQMLTELSSMPHGIVLRKALETEIAWLKDVTTCKTWEETLGRKDAVKAMEKITSYIDADRPNKQGKPSYE